MAKKLKIVAHLGGFQSFVGSLGRSMEGSGLEKALENVYGKNTVNHIFSGKAIARALRGHFLVDAVLTIKLLSPLFPASQNFLIDTSQVSNEQTLTPEDLESQEWSIVCIGLWWLQWSQMLQ